MLLLLKKLKERKSEESASSIGKEGDGRHRRALEGVRHLRKTIKKHPRRIVREFEARVKKDLGVRTEQQAWSYPSWCK
eukprot:12108365-Karenia_brevis.AAC.1